MVATQNLHVAVKANIDLLSYHRKKDRNFFAFFQKSKKKKKALVATQNFFYIKKYKRNSFLLSFLPKTSVVKHKKMVFFKDLRIKQFGFYFNN